MRFLRLKVHTELFIKLIKKLLYISLIIFSCTAFAQENTLEGKKILQLTGVIFTPDSSSVIPGVHVYVPTAGRGTTTNPYGFFSMPVLEGDSVIFSSVGFKRQYYIVPEYKDKESLRLVFTMQEDITFLNEVEVFPYPTEQMFKAALISMELPNEKNYNNLNAWINASYMKTDYQRMTPEIATQKYYQQMQGRAYQDKYILPANNLLNPYAWASFIKSLKKNKKARE